MIQKYLQGKKLTLMLATVGGAAALSPLSQAGELNFSGFMSIGGGFVADAVEPIYTANDPRFDPTAPFEYYGFVEDDITFNRNLFGLQLTGDISETLSATAQLTSRSENDYQVEAEWAYMTYALSDESQLRFGRLRQPLYLYSDFLDVGYSYPWVAPPREVYYLAVSNIDGVDFYTTQAWGSFDISFQAYFGSFSDDYEYIPPEAPETKQAFDVSSRNQTGLAFTIGRDAWNFRAAFHRTDFTLDLSENFAQLTTAIENDPLEDNDSLVDSYLLEDDSTQFIDLAFTYDNGSLFAALEHIQFEVDDSFLAKQVRQYATLGYRFGNFMVHGTYQISEDERQELENQVIGTTSQGYADSLALVSTTLLRDQTVTTAGIRWDFTPGAAFKLQIDQVTRTEYFTQEDADQTVVQFAIQSVF